MQDVIFMAHSAVVAVRVAHELGAMGMSYLESETFVCKVLLVAARAKIKHVPHHVRILDLPCGDFTWMPQCLRDVESHAPPETPLRLVYRRPERAS